MTQGFLEEQTDPYNGEHMPTQLDSSALRFFEIVFPSFTVGNVRVASNLVHF